MAEVNRRWSPYTYVEDSPIRMIDPDGMDVSLTLANPNSHASKRHTADDLLDLGDIAQNADRDAIASAQAALGLASAISGFDLTGSSQNGPSNTSNPAQQQPPKHKKKQQDSKTNDQLTNAQWKKIIDVERMIGDHMVLLATSGLMPGEEGSETSETNAVETEQGVTVLGKFPAYLELAKAMGANVFNIEKGLWNTLSEEEQWALNTKFIDDAVARGDKIVLEHPVFNINEETGVFRKELDYLYNVHNYRLNYDGTQMVK